VQVIYRALLLVIPDEKKTRKGQKL
jgi:hypothetical protein